MTTNQKMYGSNIYTNNYIVAPVSALHVPVGDPNDLTKFPSFSILAEDEETILGKYTVEQFTIKHYPLHSYVLSTDKQYFKFGFEFSNLMNNDSDVKMLLQELGYVLGGTDFTNDDPLAFWYLNTSELKRWDVTSPHMVTITEDEFIV